MGLRLNGSTSGYTEIDAPAVAGSNTLVLPGGNGSSGQYLQTNGSGTLSWSGSLTLGTAQNSTSGTNIDFTGIPSWAKRITIVFSGVSTNGSNLVIVQVGTSSGVVTTGYTGASAGSLSANTPLVVNLSSGLPISPDGSASYVRHGHIIITPVSGNTWVFSGSSGDSGTLRAFWYGGTIALAAALDRVRITTVGGTDTFDAGSINIMYEG